MEETLSAAELIARGYYQVSRKYRHVAKLGPDGLPDNESLELDQETFDRFRELGGTTWVDGAHRMRQHAQRARFLDLLQSAGISAAEILKSEMTLRDLYVRLGGSSDAPSLDHDAGNPEHDTNNEPG